MKINELGLSDSIVSKLITAGIETVEEIYPHKHNLTDIPNIGTRTSETILKALNKYADYMVHVSTNDGYTQLPSKLVVELPKNADVGIVHLHFKLLKPYLVTNGYASFSVSRLPLVRISHHGKTVSITVSEVIFEMNYFKYKESVFYQEESAEEGETRG